MPGIHQHSVIMFCHEGGGWLDLAGRHTVAPGSVVQIPGWMVHRVRFKQRSRYSVLTFDAAQFPPEWTHSVEAQRLAPVVLARPSWEVLFERWQDQADELLPRLARQLPSVELPASVREALALAHQAAAQNRAGAGEIARRLGYSLPHLTTQVARYTGRSLGQWVLEARLDLAALLLRDQGTVAQVAERCGYVDLSHFRRAFKKRTGQAPSQFKQEVTDDHF